MRGLSRFAACGGLVTLLLVCGCAALHPRPEDPGLTLLPPAGAGFSRTLTQALTVTREKTSVQVMVVAELTQQSDRLVVLGPLGNRVLTLVWDGQHLDQQRDPTLPKDFPAELVLRDLQLAYWTPESIRAALPASWSLDVTPQERTVRHDGREVIAIHFAGDRFTDPITLAHRTLGYALSITQVAP